MKCILLNKILEESLLLIKKICDKMNHLSANEIMNIEQNGISITLIQMNLKIYDTVPDLKIFLSNCNKIFNNEKMLDVSEIDNKSISHSESEIRLSNKKSNIQQLNLKVSLNVT